MKKNDVNKYDHFSASNNCCNLRNLSQLMLIYNIRIFFPTNLTNIHTYIKYLEINHTIMLISNINKHSIADKQNGIILEQFGKSLALRIYCQD